MKVASIVFNPFLENTYVVSDDAGNCIIVDPGCYEKFEKDELKAYISDQHLKPKAVINTHCHIDHVLGNAFAKDEWGIPLWVPKGEAEILRSMEVYAPSWGIMHFEPAAPDRLYVAEDKLNVLDLKMQFIYAPGHSPGHMMLYFPDHGNLLGGDVIFRQSIGRTDLPGGSFETLESSIKEKVYSLPDETIIYPGHGDETTVGFERSHNPFVQG